MNKRCASSITGNWEDDHSILKTDNKEHLLGWRVYLLSSCKISLCHPGWMNNFPLLFPHKINICWGLVIIGYTARVRPRVCVQLYTCLWLSVHVLVATFHQTRPECDGAAQNHEFSDNNQFGSDEMLPVAGCQWVQRIKWVWFPFYERNELLEAWKCFWYWLPQSLVTFGVTKCHNPTVSWNEEIFKTHIAW